MIAYNNIETVDSLGPNIKNRFKFVPDSEIVNGKIVLLNVVEHDDNEGNYWDIIHGKFVHQGTVYRGYFNFGRHTYSLYRGGARLVVTNNEDNKELEFCNEKESVLGVRLEDPLVLVVRRRMFNIDVFFYPREHDGYMLDSDPDYVGRRPTKLGRAFSWLGRKCTQYGKEFLSIFWEETKKEVGRKATDYFTGKKEKDNTLKVSLHHDLRKFNPN